jgi:hypothetical protein
MKELRLQHVASVEAKRDDTSNRRIQQQQVAEPPEVEEPPKSALQGGWPPG